MNFLTRFSLKNAVAVFIISFLLIVGGIYSFSKLKIEQFPEIEFPQITIEAIFPGASPDDVNEQVVTKLEEKFKSIEGVTKITSSAYNSIGVINLEFPFETDLDKVEQQINSSLDESGVPKEVEIKLNRLSFGAFPIYNISFFSPNGDSIEEVMKENVIPELKKIEGINNVSVAGLTDNLVQITVDKEKAEQLGLSLSSIRDQVNNKFLSFPAGKITENQMQIPLRVEEKLDSVSKLENLQLTTLGGPAGVPNSAPILLKDIASIEPITKKSEIARFNEKNALSMAITKKQGANTVEVANKVRDVLDKYDDQLDYTIGIDSAENIEKSVSTLLKEGLLGALFASVAVLIFLRNVRATVIAVVSIPMSLLIAAIFLKQMDITLNIMTLGGMAVAVGRVVDDSIVVIENIFRRVRKSKEGLSDHVIIESTKEILRAVTSSTITTVVVFLPIGFVGGITGKFFLPFALTIVFSLLASLLVSITIVPILAKFAFKKVPPEEKEGALQKIYGAVIEKSLNHKIIILVVSFGLLIGSFAIVPSLGFTFIPNEASKTLTTSIELPSSSSLESTNEASLLVEDMFSELSEIENVTAAIGARDFATGLRLDNKASYFLNLSDGVDVEETIKKVQTKLENIVEQENVEMKISVQELSTGGPPTNNNVDIDLFSNDLDALRKASAIVEEYMTKNNNLKNVTNNFSEKERQFLINIDPKKSSEYGVSGFQILGTVSDQTRPVNIGDLTLDNVVQSVQLSYNQDLKSKSDIENITIFSQRGPVKLKELAQVKEIEAFTSIQKLDTKVYARVSGQAKGNDVQAVSAEVKSDVEKLKLPKGVSLTSGGGNNETVEVFQSLGIAILVAIGLVYLSMLVTFGKARIPFIILSSLIFVPIGSLVSLLVAKEPLSVSVMIGFLMLIGIVTTNAIVMVDRIGQNRSRGLTIRNSLIEAGKTRLRPILMTAFATIAALIPLAMTTSSGTLISKGLAVTVIGGLTSSTLLTLIIVPVVYELFFMKTSRKEMISQSKER